MASTVLGFSTVTFSVSYPMNENDMVAPVGTLVSVKVPSEVDNVAPLPLTEMVTPAIGALFSSRTVPDIRVRFCAEAISQQNIQHSTVYIVQNFFIILKSRY